MNRYKAFIKNTGRRFINADDVKVTTKKVTFLNYKENKEQTWLNRLLFGKSFDIVAEFARDEVVALLLANDE